MLSLLLAMSVALPKIAAADDDDPPSRVARLSFVRGSVSFEPAGTDDWVSAVINRPLTTGDKLWNDTDSLSELHLGSAALRLGNSTGITFLNLTDSTVQVSLTEGTLNIRVRRLGDDETFEVDTPNLAFTLLRPGNYKVNVNESGDATVVLVREGQGEVTGGGSAYTVHPREVATFTGTDQIDADVEPWDNSSDDFDNWCSEREERVDHSVSARYVSDDVIGYEDLDQYGDWRPAGEYGEVWFPRTTMVGWAPYHYGHWVYIAPWGYTWVDDAPWGFAPFHYGRWVVVGGVWGWVPAPPRPVVVGAVYVRPVYAPALVAWVGGPHFAVGVGFGAGVNVAWFPLGPREVYVPSYHVSREYVTNVNVTNTRVETTVVNNYYNTTVINHTTVNVTYVNQRVPGAVVATTSETFTSARPVARNVVAVNVREVATAPVVYRAPAVAPTRAAVIGAGVAVRVRPPAVVETRAIVARTAPPPPPPTFERQQEAIRANGGRPIAVSQMRQLQPTAVQARANVRVAPAAQPRAIESRSGYRQPAGQPPAVNNGVKTYTPPPANTERRGNAYNDRPPSARNNQQNENPNGVRPENRPPQNVQPGQQPNFNREPRQNVQPDERKNMNHEPAATAQPNARPNDRPNERPNDRPNFNGEAKPNPQPNAQPRVQPNENPNANRQPRPNVEPTERPNPRPNENQNVRPQQEERRPPNANKPNQPENKKQDKKPNKPPKEEKPSKEHR